MFSAAFWWVLAGIILMICEFVVPGLILFFFGLGALITALLVWLFPLSLSLQLGIFAVASLASLFGLRRLLKSVFTGRATAMSDDALMETLAGEEGVISEPVAPGAPGKVKLHGTDWKAEADVPLEVGQAVVVVNQKSLTLVVRAR